MYYGYYWDPTYIWILPGIILALFAQIRVSATFSKYSKVHSKARITASSLAAKMLADAGIAHVRIERVGGSLTDHYDPKKEVLRLSENVYGSDSVAALGIAAHEVGHAIQHSERYAPLVIRNAIYPVARFGSMLAVPLIIIGIVLSYLNLAYAGVILFGASTLFQLITLPVEFNASNRAYDALSASYLDYDEARYAKKVLNAAALTYIASLLVSMLQLLRFMLILSGSGSRKK